MLTDAPGGDREDSIEVECEFNFIADPEVRGALQRYYRLSRHTFNMACYPWTALFAGRAIETILLDHLNADRTGALLVARSSLVTNRTVAATGGSDIVRLNLIELISVAMDRGLVPRSAARLSDIRGGPNLTEDEWKEIAKIAIEVLLTIDRKLS